jgi:hypothetical protein
MIVRSLRVLLVIVCTALAGGATAEIALVTRIDGAIASLSREEAEQLYLGRLSALRSGTPVRLLDLPPGPTRDAFYLWLTGKNGAQTRAYWSRMVFTGRARPPREVADGAALRAALRDDPHLIGYLPTTELVPELRVLLRLP